MENAERVIRALSQLPFGVAAEIAPAELLRRGVTMIGDNPNVDVLTRAWNLQWAQAAQDIAVFNVAGLPIPTVSLANLIESKRTGRSQDVADIEVLELLLRLRADESCRAARGAINKQASGYTVSESACRQTSAEVTTR